MNDIDKDRSMLVVKHNDLIQKASYNLTALEQKLIIYAISKIKPADHELDKIEIRVDDFCSICGIDKTYFYTEFKEIIDNLDGKTYWVQTDEKLFKFRWFSEAEYVHGEGKVRVLLNTNLKQYLIDLKEHFTEYELYNILALKSKYSIRLFELFKSYSYQSFISFEIEKLKHLLFLDDNYKNFAHLKKYVLDKAIGEINKYTELEVEYKTITKGRKVVEIAFYIKRKGTLDSYISYRNTIDKINEDNGQIKGQVTIYDLFKDNK